MRYDIAALASDFGELPVSDDDLPSPLLHYATTHNTTEHNAVNVMGIKHRMG